MEKFRIGLYGIAQVMAISYGVLFSGAAVKFNRFWIEMGYAMPPVYYHAKFYRDHGYWLLLIVVLWAVTMSWFSSKWADWKLDESDISASGVALTLLFICVGTYLAFGASAAPPHLITAALK